MKVLETAGGAVAAVAVFLVSAVLLVGFLGLVAPYVHSLCLVGRNGTPTIDEHWGFYLTEGIPNPAPDGHGCIRNTPTREALDALGIWNLGTPEQQVIDKLNH